MLSRPEPTLPNPNMALRNGQLRSPHVPYSWQYALSIGVTVILAMLGAIQIADPKLLGLSPQVLAWVGIICAGLGVLGGFLPRVTAPPSEKREGMD